MTLDRLSQSLPEDALPGSLAERVHVEPLRLAAVLGSIALLTTFVAILVDIVTVTGDPRLVLYLAAGSMLAATLFARYVEPKPALGVGVFALAVGLVVYFGAANVAFHPRAILLDSFELLTGMSVLHLHDVTVWALAVTPAPIFLTWYFTVKRQYSIAALVGSVAVGFFVLSGDAGPTMTLLGVAGATATAGLGDLDRAGETIWSAEYLVPVIALMVVAPLFVTVIPAGGGAATAPVGFDGGSQTDAGSEVADAGDRTMTGAVVDADDELEIVGAVSLWPEVHFTVRADQGQYWRTTSYDRYTGDGWVRAADVSTETEFRSAEGPTTRVDQTVRAETEMHAMPAAFRPFAVESDTLDAEEITTGASLQPERPIEQNETYTVSSSVPDASADELRAAGSEYPSEIEEAYTQLPDDVPDRLHDATDELTADAEDPYETAVTIEQYLRTNKEYSLNVDRPDGDIADAFLFEMDAGYCTYFATTMVTMLRSQDVPARMAVGYSTGQQIDEDTWAVRGSNAHAWVEVYFPEHGWQTFEPTPPSELEGTQASALENAREVTEELEGGTFDTNESYFVSAGGISEDEPEEADADGVSEEENATEEEDNEGVSAAETFELEEIEEVDGDDEHTDEAHTDESETFAVSIPSGERLALFAILALGVLTGVRRSPRARRQLNRFRVRYQRRRDPETDIHRAFERMLLLFELRYRQREQGETVREYLDAIEPDPRARRVLTIRERARYRGEVSEATADEAVRLVGELIEGPQ